MATRKRVSIPMLLACLALGVGAVQVASAALPTARNVRAIDIPERPAIHGPRVFGVRPGSPFLFAIPATGDRPLRYGAEGLPAGLSVDAERGWITGVLREPGRHRATLRVSNSLGVAERELRIVVGDRVALTPPLGWNSWNCWAGSVDQERVLRTAHAMVASGLADHGWSYICIDDTWQGKRGGPYNAILGNERFPDMKGLCDSIHELGLKVGIYSTPWARSFAGHIGSTADYADGSYDPPLIVSGLPVWKRDFGRHSFVQNDVRQWAEWGVDFLKYDWRPIDVKHAEEMSVALRRSGRDIVYSLSNSAPFALAPEWARLAECWRTTGDLNDSWANVSRIGFAQARWAPHSGPGRWSDPDMLVVGRVGWGAGPAPSRLTRDEQRTHISLWCLLAAPLILGCDLANLDPFTLSLLTNDEVLDVNQDPLGAQARPVARRGDLEVWAKEMEDGSRAVGLFNRGGSAHPVAARWADLGLTGPQQVRDLWRGQEMGVFEEGYRTAVPAHGVVLIRVAGDG